MLILFIIVVLLIVAAILGFYYFKSYKQFGYQEQELNLRSVASVREIRELNEAQEIIHCVKTRRESIGRRSSFEEASGEFVNLRNVKLSRAMSCESVISETSEVESWEAETNFGSNSSEHKVEIPDIKAWLKNPTDFIKFPTSFSSTTDGTSNNSASLSQQNSTDSGGIPSEMDTGGGASSSTSSQLLVSMSYLPTAERLSVVIVRLRVPNAQFRSESTSDVMDDGQCETERGAKYIPKMVYVKAYLLDEDTGKRAYKKKTSIKPFEMSNSGSTVINFNELMIFKLPINQLSKTGIRISVTGVVSGGGVGLSTGQDMDDEGSALDDHNSTGGSRLVSLGWIVIGSSSSLSSGVSHFATMTTTMRKPITMWHILQGSQL